MPRVERRGAARVPREPRPRGELTDLLARLLTLPTNLPTYLPYQHALEVSAVTSAHQAELTDLLAHLLTLPTYLPTLPRPRGERRHERPPS